MKSNQAWTRPCSSYLTSAICAYLITNLMHVFSTEQNFGLAWESCRAFIYKTVECPTSVKLKQLAIQFVDIIISIQFSPTNWFRNLIFQQFNSCLKSMMIGKLTKCALYN